MRDAFARRPRGRLYRASLGILFAATTFYVAEIGLRLAGAGPAYEAGMFGSWRMTPNLDRRNLRGPRDGHDFHVSTNADGLRTDLGRARAAGLARVAVMGDSTVFGWGVDDGWTVGDGLQAALDAAGPGTVEVLNAGQPGYSTTQISWLFDEVVAEYQPDRVIVFISMHDFNRVLVSDRELLEGGATLGADLRLLLARHSRVYQILRQAVFPLADQPMLLPDQATGEPRVERVSDEERSRALDDMRARLSAWGGRVMIGFLPFHADLIGVAGERKGLSWAQAYGAAHDVELVDLRRCCTGAELVLPDDQGHLAGPGNLQVGAAAAPLVRRSLGLE
jgi:hypothetical protein